MGYASNRAMERARGEWIVWVGDDMVFLDLGPVFGTWEADVGKSYALGDDPVKRALCRDLEAQFALVCERFHAEPDITGAALSAFGAAGEGNGSAARDAVEFVSGEQEPGSGGFGYYGRGSSANAGSTAWASASSRWRTRAGGT